MRATWFTSMIAGVLIGFATHATEAYHLGVAILILTFALSMLIAVIGIPQLRDANAEMKRRGCIALMQKSDLSAFYLPAWGRMLICFMTSVASILLLKALGL
jgi:hypothetical protein